MGQIHFFSTAPNCQLPKEKVLIGITIKHEELVAMNRTTVLDIPFRP